MTKPQWAVTFAILAGGCAVIVYLIFLSVDHARYSSGEVLHIPSGYRGWLIQEWKVPGSPVPETTDTGRQIIVFNSRGYCAVPIPMYTGYTPIEKCYYWDGQKKTPLTRAFEDLDDDLKKSDAVVVWGGNTVSHHGSDGSEVLYSVYFVGSYRAYITAAEDGWPSVERMRSPVR